MSIYEYACHECQIIWECDFPFAKQEKTTPCPKCEAACGQNWSNREIPVHFKGAGWTGVNKATGLNKTGGSDEINLRLQDQVKDRIAGGWKNYSRYEPSEGYIKETNARKLNNDEITQKLDASKKLSAEVYDKAGIDPTNKYKGQ